MKLEEKASKEAAKLVVEDLKARKGLGDEWEVVEPRIQVEIINEWASIIYSYLYL